MSYQPNNFPPSYDQAVNSKPSTSTTNNPSSHLTVPQTPSHNGIPAEARRSMEDEQRSLPEGWVRQFDHESGHQFFVDTRVKPPRAIWHHPYDDEEYLSTLSPEQLEKTHSVHKPLPHNYYSAFEDHNGEGQASQQQPHSQPIASRQQQTPAKESLGQKLKDKLTGSTHAEREQQRNEQAAAEQRAYQHHQATRNALTRAMQTGVPQLLGKDKDGHDLYIEPPNGPGGVSSGRPSAHNPYTNFPAYSDPNARFVRPDASYARPYGRGYGGGMGMPLYGGMGYPMMMNPLMNPMMGMGLGLGMGALMF